MCMIETFGLRCQLRLSDWRKGYTRRGAASFSIKGDTLPLEMLAGAPCVGDQFWSPDHYVVMHRLPEVLQALLVAPTARRTLPPARCVTTTGNRTRDLSVLWTLSFATTSLAQIFTRLTGGIVRLAVGAASRARRTSGSPWLVVGRPKWIPNTLQSKRVANKTRSRGR